MTKSILYLAIGWLVLAIALAAFKQTDALEEYGLRSLWVDSQQDTQAVWRDKNSRSFTCLFGSNTNNRLCGFDIRIGDGNQKGLDLSRFKYVLIQLHYEGSAKNMRIAHNDAQIHSDGTASIQNETTIQLKQGTAQYRVPLNNFEIPSWWRSNNTHIQHLFKQSSRDNVTHIGFDIQDPPDLGKHIFDVHSFHLVSLPLPLYRYEALGIFSGLYMTFSLIVLLIIRKRSGPASRSVTAPSSHLKNQADPQFTLSHTLEQMDSLTGLCRKEFAKLSSAFNTPVQRTHQVGVVSIRIKNLAELQSKSSAEVIDEVLIKLSLIIKDALREADSAVRWDSDQFILVCTPFSADYGAKLIDRIRKNFYALTFTDEFNIAIQFCNAPALPEQMLIDLVQQFDVDCVYRHVSEQDQLSLTELTFRFSGK